MCVTSGHSSHIHLKLLSAYICGHAGGDYTGAVRLMKLYVHI